MKLRLPSFISNNTEWLEQRQSTILSAATIITAANIVSSLSSLIIQRLMISIFFTTQESRLSLEAFRLAFQLPDLVFQLIVLGALSAAFIPIFTKYKKRDLQKAFTMSSIMMNTLLVIFIVASILIAIFARPLTLLRTGSGIPMEEVEIIISLTRIMLISQLFFAISNFMTGILQSFHRFVIPALSPILYNIGILLGVYFLAPSLGIYAAAVGVIFGAFMHMAIQIPLVMKLGYRYTFSFNIGFDGIKEFFRMMPPRVLAIGASQFRNLLLGFFTTSLGNLSFFMMQLALSLMVIPIRFFGIPISQASLPFLSEFSSENDRERFKSLVLQSLHQISFLTFPASVLLLILRVPVVRLVFGAANFPWENTLLTSRLVAIVVFSIAAQALTQLLIRAFYALHDTRTPLYVAGLDLLLYLSLSAGFVFFTPLGVYGIALATTITAFLEFLLFLGLLNRKVQGFAQKAFWIPQVKMIIASFFMAVFIYLPFKILDEVVFNTSRTIELIGLTVTTATIGMLVYAYFALLFDIRELRMLTGLVNKFGAWKKVLSTAPEVVVESNTNPDNPDTV